MSAELISLLMPVMKAYGAELIGSFILAATIGLFYQKSTIKDGLKYLTFAFYTIVFKNLFLILLSVAPLDDKGLQITPLCLEWINVIFISWASALFLASALQILRLLFTPVSFSVICWVLMMGVAYFIKQHFLFNQIFLLLPQIYISAAFFMVGISLIFIRSIRQARALFAIGFGFIFLGFYYTQSLIIPSEQTWFWQTLVYSVVLFLSLVSQIRLMDIYCVTLEKNLLTEKAKRELILDSSPFPILISRLLDDSVIYINPLAQKLFGVTSDEIPSFHFSHYFANPVQRIELISKIKKETVIDSFEVEMKNPKTGNTFWYDLSTKAIDMDGELALYTTFKDMTQKKHKEQDLLEKATTDSLTGLFNRRQFEVLAQKEIQIAQRHGMPFCVLMLDIDHFKKVNDTYGHDMGDSVLQQLALALKTTLRESDILARYGGEEFIVFLTHTTPNEGLFAAERIRRSIEDLHIHLNGHEVTVTISIGLSGILNNSLPELVKQADIALYESKRTGRNKATLYTPILQQKIEDATNQSVSESKAEKDNS